MRRIGWIIVPILLVGLLALVAFAARGPAPSTAFTLRAGDCLDVPGDAQIGDIATLDCAKPHDAEVFAVGDLADEAPSGPAQYPGTASIATWAGGHCGPEAINAYIGPGSAADLAVGYFFPDQAAWDRGERQVTCYLHARDGSRLTAPLGSPSPSGAAGS